MILIYFVFCYLITVTFSIKTPPEEDAYHASVVEYNPYVGKDANDTMFRNAVEYVRIIQTASSSVDIIVFPELGLTYKDTSIYVEFPFGNSPDAPVDNPSLHPVLRMLSKAARDYQVYVSFTIHEKETSSSGETLKYNTNVVLDRNGVIIARYRKYHLFNENHLNTPKVPEIVYFDTDFGVRFGMFICFDILFKEPALTLVNEYNITDIIFPSWWFSELPSLLSVQTQFAWSYMTDTNLLAAGINDIERSSTGSGIYVGKGDPLEYVFSEEGESKLLSAKVHKKRVKVEGGMEWNGWKLMKSTFFHEHHLALWREDLSSYETHLLTPVFNSSSDYNLKDDLNLTQIINKTLCQGALCCEFNLNMTFTYRPEASLNMSDASYIRNDSYYHYQYRLAIHDGVRGFYGALTAGIQVCSVIPCLNDSLSSCGQKSGNALPQMIETSKYGKLFLYATSFNNISIKAVSENATDFTFPNVLESSKSKSKKAFGSLPKVSKIKFATNQFESNLKFHSKRLVYAGTYSRIISRDIYPVNSSMKCEPCIFLSVFMALFIIFPLRKRFSV